ncbi:Stress responsive A/B Barrel Domain protein [Caballeronia temeraria]|uniref:Stress responsive A/B Barrel Domain protein n=1 Tax=Caballeronia temeraria TaxID=1777137 RepID=A0A158E208_9BURK|nr:Dabb family protein [Caballeronia temeraria]SAL00868.1 Stress responsive A/B Barrel Domain protein [Caballeronia temeraria]
MLRHIFIGPTFPDCTEGSLSGVVDTLNELPTLVPWIRAFSVEQTLDWSGIRAIVLIAEFDSQADWERYMHEPKHLALGDRIKDFIDLSKMTVVQTQA